MSSFISLGSKYTLVNSFHGTALTLVDKDGAPTLTVEELQYGDDQLWEFVETRQRGGRAIRCCKRSQDGKPFYLGVQGKLHYGASIVLSAVPLTWSVTLYDGHGLYISWPQSGFHMAVTYSRTNGQEIYKVVIDTQMTADTHNRKLPSGSSLWCYSSIGLADDPLPPSRDPPEPANGSRDPDAAQRGDCLPNTAIHILTNAQYKTALELDHLSSLVKCRPTDGGTKQQWRFIPLGAGYIIESCTKSPNGEPLYLVVDGHARPGTQVIVSRYPASWRVEYDKSSVRLFWPTTNLVASAHRSEADDSVVLAEYDTGPLSIWADAIVDGTAPATVQPSSPVGTKMDSVRRPNFSAQTDPDPAETRLENSQALTAPPPSTPHTSTSTLSSSTAQGRMDYPTIQNSPRAMRPNRATGNSHRGRGSRAVASTSTRGSRTQGRGGRAEHSRGGRRGRGASRRRNTAQ
ncbi:hypothetical protein C8Q73DRAFT_719344 [Cubamyces lactineus]|nr:hypothetical protein C8Q73DRAFT_719344 [Cubamyces lactineus]